jgi:predicted ATPase
MIVWEEFHMKLAKIAIENFRHLGTTSQPLEMSFTDALDRVRDFTLLVGPNTSGKTTILDAIAAALAPMFGTQTLRRGFTLSTRTVVRRGALCAKVTCWLRFTPDEIAATREIFQLAKLSENVPDASEVKLTWTFPNPRTTSDSEFPIRCEPDQSWLLLKGRDQVSRLMATGRADWSWYHRLGGIFTFDQERTGLGKTISRQFWNSIHGTAEAAKENAELRTTDSRTILIDLALQALVPPIAAKGQFPDEFRLIQERYARVCAPRRIVGAVRDELGELDVNFFDGENSYTYEGLSSGEKNALLLLIRFVAERMHRSIVMIDEMELNQHPVWQRKLLDMIPKMGDDNQIIATTHSPYLRDAVRPDAVIDLGDLGDHSPRGAE